MPDKKTGRPTTYTKEKSDRVLGFLETGMTLRQATRQPDTPPFRTFLDWVRDDRDGLSARYARAREIGYQLMADEILDVADDGSNDWMRSNKPNNPGYDLNGEHFQRSRLRVDTRKWLLAKALPKIYGDKLAIGGADDLPPIKTISSDMSAKEAAEAYAATLSGEGE